MTGNKLIIYKLTYTFFLAFFVAFFRLVPHLPNATPLGYSAFNSAKTRGLFSGLLVPLLALLISDIFIGMYNPSLMAIVYGSFLIYPFLGYLKKINVISLSTPFILIYSSAFFFFTTNIGVWALSNWYPKTFLGLFMCLLAGVPFWGSMLLGDIVSLLAHRLFVFCLGHIKKNVPITRPSFTY